MASCNIIRDDKGTPVSTEAPNGKRSILFDSLMNKIQNPRQALNAWLVSRTKEFNESVINPIKQRGKKVTEEVYSPIRVQNSELIFEPRINPFTGEDTGQIELVLVKTNPEDRGQGLAKKAIGKFLDYADSIGKPTYLVISPREAGVSEKGLIKLYESFGYEMMDTGFEMVRPAGNRSLPEVLEGMDENGEPKMEVLLNYIDSSSEALSQNEDINIPKEDVAEYKDIMMGVRVRSTNDLTQKLKSGFMPDGYFNPTRESLAAVKIYNAEEITDILSNSELQDRIKTFIYKLTNLDGEVLNDGYVDENFLVVKDGTKNSIGKFKLANPYLVEKQAINILGGISTRAEFEDVLFNNDEVEMLRPIYLETQGTSEDLFMKFKDFKKIGVISYEGGQLTSKLNNTREYMEQVLTEPETTLLEENLDYLIQLEGQVFEENPEAISKLTKEVSKELLNIGMDVTDLDNVMQGKSIAEFKEFLSSIYDFITTETDQAFDNMVGNYNQFFGVNNDFTFKNVPIRENVSANNSFFLETESSDIELFNNTGLIPIGPNVYKRVSKSTTLEELYNRVYTNTITNGYNNILSDEAVRPTGYDSDGSLNLSKIMDPSNKDAIIRDMKAYIQTQISDIFVGEENISQEDLERYALMFNYLNRSSDFDKFKGKPVLDSEYSTYVSKIDNQQYLKTDFIADFNKRALAEKAKDSLEYKEFYSNFEINNVGIRLLNNDPVSLSKISKYLENNQDLVNYMKLHKQGVDLAPEVVKDPIRDDVFLRNYYANFPQEVDVFKGSYNELSQGTIIAETKEPFIRTKAGLYELITGVGSKGVYGKLNTENGLFKTYSETLPPPTLDIDISEISAIEANLNSEIELNNLYSQEEKDQIDNEHDNC